MQLADTYNTKLKIRDTMANKMCLYALVFVAVATGFTTAGEFDNCKTFIPIPEEKQNRDPKTLPDLTSRPLGYDSAVIPFNDPNKRDPCFTVKLNNSQMQTVEVMGIKTCQDSAIGAENNEIKYVFYCEGCETDITFWYRFTVSPLYTNGLDFEYWCQETRNYPNSLIVGPNLQEVSTTPTSGSWLVSRTFSWLFLLSFPSFYFVCSSGK